MPVARNCCRIEVGGECVQPRLGAVGAGAGQQHRRQEPALVAHGEAHENRRRSTGKEGSTEDADRAGGVHEPGDQDRSGNAAQAVERRRQHRPFELDTSVAQQRGQPAGQEEDRQQVREEAEPEQAGGHGASVVEQPGRGRGAVLKPRAGDDPKETRRLRQPAPRHGSQQQGSGTAQDEHGLPAMGRRQLRRHDAAQKTAQGKAADHGADRQGPATVGHGLGGERDHVGQRAADAEPGDEAQEYQRHERAGPGGRQRAQAAEEEGRDDRRAAAEAVGRRAEQHRAECEAAQPGGEGRRERTRSHAPVVHQQRGGVGQRLRVESVENRDEEANGKGAPSAHPSSAVPTRPA